MPQDSLGGSGTASCKSPSRLSKTSRRWGGRVDSNSGDFRQGSCKFSFFLEPPLFRSLLTTHLTTTRKKGKTAAEVAPFPKTV